MQAKPDVMREHSAIAAVGVGVADSAPRHHLTRTISALHGGPSLRKLLGAAGPLWGELQARARRADHAPFVVKTKELALVSRPARALRTVEWALNRLASCGVIEKRRLRYGL